MVFKVGDLVKHFYSAWIGHILEIAELDVTIRIMYTPQGIVGQEIMLLPHQMLYLEKVI
tara:strand:- start:475 stop:651 length:177 start_codon:yes stop_codon:yes gene_type:complete